MAELSLIGLLSAFAAGVVSFLSPCVLPLVPGYVSFVAGSSLEDLRAGAAPRLQTLTLAASFVLGFTVVFVALGASATALGSLLLSYKLQLGMIAGGDYEGPGDSPDRADAMVWGLTELMLGPEQSPPRVRGL